jgi:hypothetical protein
MTIHGVEMGPDAMTKRWRFSGLALVAAIVSLLIAAAGVQAQADPCQAAEAKLTEKSYPAARDAYAALLAQDEKPACAQAGMDFVKVFALSDLGLYAEARTQLAEAVKNHPGAKVPEGLRYLNGGKFVRWWWVEKQMDPWILPAGEALALVVKALALVVIVPLTWLALRWKILPWVRGFSRYPLRLDVQAFDDGATGFVLGKGLAAKCEEEIRRFGEQEDIDLIEVRLLATPIQPPTLPAEIKAATPQLAIVSQLIEWALPQKVITLTGFLQNPVTAALA